jgi:hypothetical protein
VKDSEVSYPEADERSDDAPRKETLTVDVEAPGGMPADLPAPRPVGQRRLVRNIALAALALVLVAGAVGSVLLASQAHPAVPARILNPDGLAQGSNIASYPTIAPIQATPVVCPCGTPMHASVPLPPGGAPNIAGQVVLVSLSHQWLWAFSNRQLVFSTPVTTGRPELPTPTGIFDIYQKVEDTMFYSPWPPGSPYYYTPEHVNYAMLFLTGGFYLHDAPWRSDFGPGSNVPHTGPGGQAETGSHGCVELPTGAGAWLYGWAPYGTTVDIIG